MKTYSTELACHPETPSAAMRRIEACVCWQQNRTLAFAYIISGDIHQMRVPPSRPSRRAEGLWQHTCFEAFVAVGGNPEYLEFNFAPSGEWAAYGFRSYRDGAPLENEQLAPKITARGAGDRFDLEAMIDLHRLPMIRQNICLELGLSAVIEEQNGVLSYWALKHPPGRPDFHHRDGFALEIEPPDVEIISEERIEKR